MLAFQRTAGSEDLLGQVWWHVGQRSMFLVWHGWEDGGSGSGVAAPDEHLALLVPGKLVHLNDFVLEEFKQVVVQLKLDLERAIRDTSATPKHLQCLLQDFVKGYDLPSPELMAAQVSLAAHHTRTQDAAPCGGRNRRDFSQPVRHTSRPL